MARTITLDTLEIESLAVDYGRRVVIVAYALVDSSTGKPYEKGRAFFWETMPDLGTDPEGNPIPAPANWYTLASQYWNALDTVHDRAATLLAGLLS